MMNNQFNTANISTQHGIQMAQHVSTSPPQASAAVLNTFLNAQQQQQQQQLAAAVAAGAIYGDPRQLQLNSNTLDKNYYTTTAATLGTLGTPQRFYTTAGPATATEATNPQQITATAGHHPNTILITNNFAHQQAGQSLSPDHHRNIRIVTSSSNPLNTTNTASMATTASGFQHAQHVFNLNNNKQLHLFPQHLLHQSNFQPATTTELLQQHFAPQHFTASQQQQQQQNHSAASAIQIPQFYVSPENSITGPLNSNPKLITTIPSNSAATAGGNTTTASLVGNGSNPNSSTVVLDRINICINNLYTDTSSSSSASNSLASTPAQQPSPIIPAIQHKPIIESGPALPMADMYESDVLVIDEPDSTTTATTPHTPPTTPENTPPSMPNIGNNNNNNNIISTTSSINSPSTSCNYQKLEKSNAITTTKQSFASAAQNIEKAAQDSSDCIQILSRITTATTTDTNTISQSKNFAQQTARNITTTSNTPLTPPTPPSPEMTNNNKEYLNESDETPTAAVVPAPLFANGEDVFIKRHDDRFYLGTVIDTARNQFLVRFDDKTEVWCDADEMRKLGGSSANNTTSADEKSVDQPMCVACKRSRPESKVEICERCGRGYHRKCTTETSPGSDDWLCKRCAKPMKLDDLSKFSSTEEETEVETCLELHYDIESLTWDDKHRSNEEQIYCYCGKSGKFDHNMLQCWRCLNWYHNHCTQKCTSNLLRGDSFFVFCCSVCNDGEEYLRRLQTSWIDLVHLVLYNLSCLKKHHKCHHLLKDINPYVLEKRKILPIPKEWISMPEKEFLDKVKCTLNENVEIFMCGKEIKRDANSFALRSLEPPVVKKISIKSQDTFNDEFIFNNLKLQLLNGAPENSGFKFITSNCMNIESTPTSKRKLNEDSSSHDVYEFDDTSEDEIPIKRILDKVKKTKLSPQVEATRVVEPKTPSSLQKTSAVTTLEIMNVEDDNANDALLTALPVPETYAMSTPKCKKEQTPKKETKTISPHKSPSGSVTKCKEQTSLHLGEKLKSEKSSRKRKAFTLSKSYAGSRLIDSSSDENSSSSSRGTSLDLIIPPPKNFLGQNNPFRIISPKKNAADVNASTSSGKKSVSFGIFNTTALNFSSKLAALKSAGLFPKLSTSNLAKAAGQPRTVRTIKRRLSAKDITIGPNKEVRRRRTRRLSSNIEVISTTTINPIPTNFFPIQAKDLLAAAAASTTTAASLFTTTQTKTSPTTSSSNNNNNISTAVSSSPNMDTANVENTAGPPATNSLPTHGRRLRQRPQKNSPNTSRRSSISSNQSSTSSATAAAAAASQTSNPPPHQYNEDLKQTVNKYFGIVNRIESGEQFSIRAKRQLANGQMQYLIEWGEAQPPTAPIQNLTTDTIKLNPTADETTNSQLMEVSTTT
ncbi:polycomb protein Pcl [Calliphora vicina]|uniref:polycomb protein Pcl n=1 Tax=Calliphora vicina TaxID=7373 RepID=UPI00325AC15E